MPCAQNIIDFTRSTRSSRAGKDFRASRWNGFGLACRSSRSSGAAGIGTAMHPGSALAPSFQPH